MKTEVEACLVRVAIAVKRHHGHANSYKGPAYKFKSVVHSQHDRKHGSTQADMVLEKELRVLHLDPRAARRGRLKAWRMSSFHGQSPEWK